MSQYPSYPPRPPTNSPHGEVNYLSLLVEAEAAGLRGQLNHLVRGGHRDGQLGGQVACVGANGPVKGGGGEKPVSNLPLASCRRRPQALSNSIRHQERQGPTPGGEGGAISTT
jgi:hypothetical protein